MNLTKDQIQNLIFTNKYKVEPSQKFLSRCIEGCYEAGKNLHPLSMAGADAGELAILYATANSYGFEINEEKVYATFLEVIGGAQNFSTHEGCTHMKQIRSECGAYSLDPDQLDLISSQISQAEKNGANKTKLKEGGRAEAVIQITGDWSIYPQYHIQTSQGSVPVLVHVFHKSLTDARHKILATKLIENKAVTLYDDLDDEYLYQVISTQTEDHLFETIKRIASSLPIFDVIFQPNGNYTLEERGLI
jgi:hypothetical protein